MQEISASEANVNSSQQISVKYLPLPHPDVKLMTKDLTQINVYTYFNIGYAKTLVKLKEKKNNSLRVVPYTDLSTNFANFFVSLVLNFGQVTKLLTETVTIAYSLLE